MYICTLWYRHKLVSCQRMLTVKNEMRKTMISQPAGREDILYDYLEGKVCASIAL